MRAREALLAIPGVNPAMLEQFLLQRQDALATGQPVLPFAGGGSFAAMSSGLSAYSVRSEAKMADGSAFVRQSIFRLNRNPKRPALVLTWNEGDAEPPVSSNPMAKN